MNWQTVIARFWALFFAHQKPDQDEPGNVDVGQIDTCLIGEGLEDEADYSMHEEVIGSKLFETIKSLEEQLEFANERLDVLRPIRVEIIKLNKEYGSAPQEADQIRKLWTWTRREIRFIEELLGKLLEKQKEETQDTGPNQIHWNGAWRSWDRVIDWLCSDRPSVIALAKVRSKVIKARKQRSITFAHYAIIRFMVAAKQKNYSEAKRYSDMISEYKLRDRVKELAPQETKEFLSADDRDPGESIDQRYALTESELNLAIDCRKRGINSIEFFEKDEVQDTGLDPRTFHIDTWAAFDFNKSKAAQSVGMSRSKFSRLLKKEMETARQYQ